LIELDGAVMKDDARLKAIGSEFGAAFLQADVIGGYARPLVLASKNS
jgi:hypothetical protein